MTIKKGILVFYMVLFSTVLVAQTGSKNKRKFGDWFSTSLEIRQTFDGSKAEKKPARLIFNEDNNSKDDFINIDIGVRVLEIHPIDGFLSMYPDIEWHKTNNKSAEKNKLSFGLKAEVVFDILKGNVILLSDAILRENFLDDVSEFEFDIQATFFRGKENEPDKYKFRPGERISYSKGIKDLKFRYQPFIGFEYREMPDLLIEDITQYLRLLYTTLSLEWWPWQSKLEFLFDATYRRSIKEIAGLKQDLSFIDASLVYYPFTDIKQSVIGVGLNYQLGYDPEAKFNNISIISLSLDIKIN